MTVTLLVRFLVCLVVLFGIGLGPALALLRGVSRRFSLALALAPAVTLAIVAVLGLPLVMFIGPVTRWAYPLTAGLLVLSAGLVVWERRQDRSLFEAIRFPAILGWATVFLSGCAILVAPAVALGAQYAAFRSNPGDSFTYMSLAETVRKVDWDMIQAGKTFTAVNLDNIARLAAESPTALYSARLLGRSFPINHVANLAWLAQLAGVSTQRFYFPFHIILSATMLPAIVALGFQVRVRRWLLALTALAATTGFWMRLVIETDASAELGAAPLLALAVFGWMLIARASARQNGQSQAANRWRLRLLTALAWAALAVVYRPFGIIILGALFFHLLYDVFVLRDWRGWLATCASVAIIALLLLVLTGQAGYYLPGFLDAAGSVEAEAKHEPVAFEVLSADKLGGVANLPIYQLWRDAHPGLLLVLTLLLQAVGLGLVILWLMGLLASLRDRSQNRPRAIFFFGLAGSLLFLVLLLVQNPKAAGKAYTSVYAYIFLGMVIGAEVVARRLQDRRRQVFLAAIAVWLVLVVIVGTLLPFDSRSAGRFARARANRAGDALDLQPITAVLDRADPGLVLVSVPRDKRFFFAFYTMLALADYPTYFQSGLIIDGDDGHQNLWLSELERVPDYVLISKPADYLAGAGMGRLAAETENLRLYRLETGDAGAALTFLRSQEVQIKTQEASKAMFPSLVP